MAGERVRRVVQWEEPPGRRRARDKNHHAVAQLLQSRPGEWANIGEYESRAETYSTASSIRAGRLTAYQPRGAYEAVARVVDGAGYVWVRYVGESDGHA